MSPGLVPSPGVDAANDAAQKLFRVVREVLRSFEDEAQDDKSRLRLLRSIRDGGTSLVNATIGNPFAPLIREFYRQWDLAVDDE